MKPRAKEEMPNTMPLRGMSRHRSRIRPLLCARAARYAWRRSSRFPELALALARDHDPPAPRSIVVAHSSDLHLGGYSQSLAALEQVLHAAAHSAADVLLLAGDVFDHNRLPLALVDRATRQLGDFSRPVIILPGNHDPVTPDSVYRRGGLAEPANVHVFGVDSDGALVFPNLDLAVWGRAHMDYVDMAPLEDVPGRSATHHVVTAHGHWHKGPDDEHRAWRFTSEDIAAVDADYIALGHWDRAVQVADGDTPAYYSGSPDLARSINVVTMGVEGGTRVERVRLGDGSPK